jgi:hypothetical protein
MERKQRTVKACSDRDPRGYKPYLLADVRNHSPTISPIMMQVRLVLARGTNGMIDASATTS